jgi:hypothetical protein
LYMFFLSPFCAACTAHLNLLDLVMLIIFREKQKLWSNCANFSRLLLLSPKYPKWKRLS